jgi:hypothetical protein
MAQITRNNHYVPICLSKRFRGDDGYLRGFIRLEARFVRRVPRKMFVEWDYYTQVLPDGAILDHVERALQVVEGRTGPVLKKIIAAARAGRTPSLTREERAQWDMFFQTQRRRVPDQHSTTGLWDDFESSVRQWIREYEEKRGPVAPEVIERLLSTGGLAGLKHNARAESVVRGAGEVLRVLAQRGLAVVCAPSGGARFILGSHPVVKLTPEHTTDLRSHEVESWLAIAPDVMVGPGLAAGTEALAIVTDVEQVHEVNDSVARQSSIIAGTCHGDVRIVVERLGLEQSVGR